MKKIIVIASLLVGLVTGVFAQTADPRLSDSLTSANDTVVLGNLFARGTAAFQVTGTFSGTITFEGSLDEVTWVAVQATNAVDGSQATTTTSTGLFQVNAAAFRAVRARMSSYTSGTAVVYVQASSSGGGSGGSATITGDVTVGDVGITSIAAGDNNIGNVDVASIAAGDNNIGNVDVVSSALPTGASTSAKQDTGNTSLSSIDGKITAVNTGAVVVSSSALPSGAATSANQSTEITALQLIDNLPNTLGSTTSGQSGVVALGAVTTAAPSYITAQSNALSLDTSGNLRVAGAVSCSNCSGTGVSVNEDVASANADPGTPAYTVRQDTPSGTTSADGDYQPLKTDSVGKLWVNAVVTTMPSTTVTASNLDVQIGGSDTVAANITQVGGSTQSATNPLYVRITDGTTAVPLSTGGAGTIDSNTGRITIATDDPVNDFAVKADANMVAHGASDAGNPLKIGCRADANLSDNSLVSTGQRSDMFCDLDGAIITRRVPLTDILRERATNTNGTSTAFTSGLGAPGSGIRLWVTKCTFSNSSASMITVDLQDGASGTVLWTTPVPATGGATEVWLDTPMPLTANTALAYHASAATTTLTVSCMGFKSKI